MTTCNMAPRIPSNSSALERIEWSKIRHRSGTHSPKITSDPEDGRGRRISLGGRAEHADPTPTIQAAKTESRPSVLLVRRSRVSTCSIPSRFKTLPELPPEAMVREDSAPSHTNSSRSRLLPTPEREDAPIDPRLLSPIPPEGDRKHGAGADFTHVPLTPHLVPAGRGRSDWSMHSGQSGASRLPTPDYNSGTGTNVKRALTSYFPRLPSLNLNFYPFRSRPVPARASSDGSTCSQTSSSSASTVVSHHPTHSGAQSATSSEKPTTATVPTAIKDKRPLLLSTWSTSDKFTRKFPRPRVLKDGSWLAVGSVSAAASTLEGGEDGLGMDRPGRWTPHKWCLVFSVCTLLVYGGAGLVCSILTWFRAWRGAEVMYVADYDLLVLLTLASSILLLAFLVGIAGALLNSRPLLACYALLLWPAFLALLAVAYPAYKRHAYALDRKLSLAWSAYYTPRGRLAIQDALHCCGFFSALHAASPSSTCYPRTPLPGCKGPLWRVERERLATLASTLFALVPLHVLNIAIVLLCANHVTRTFGKGIMPKRYRLNVDDVRADAAALLGAAMGREKSVLRHPGLARAPSSRTFREKAAG
ncbi:hypothetical protein V8D89_005445 [Ganoderma adspersum]